jgi:anti-sigma factor ChrR (cupin superfamily)
LLPRNRKGRIDEYLYNPFFESERFREVPMICLRLRAPWLSLALLTICVGHAFAQVPATLSASFNPSTVVAGGTNTTVYDVTISNPNGSDTLTGIAFSVSFPASITLSSFGSVTCAGSGGSNPHGFNFSGVTLAAGESCDVPVRAQALSTASGAIIVTTSTVTSNEAGPGTAASATLTVTALAATSFSVVAGTPVVGFNQDSITITCLDQRGNIFTSYAGNVNLTSTEDPFLVYSNGNPVTLTNGTGSFNVAPRKSGTFTITATDSVNSSITGTSNVITDTPGPTTMFVVSASSPQTAGTAFNFTVTAVDLNNNTTPAYTGTVHFTSTDGSATLPADSTLTNGVGTFSVTLKTAGNRTITATDTVTSSITGTSGTITVNAAAATTFTVSASSPHTAGTAFNFTVTALDQFSNTATGYTGTVHFTSTDGSATLPANSTLTNGAGTFSVTLKTAGTQTLTATDTVTPSITGTSGTITVNPAAATTFTVSASSPHTAGTAFNFTVTALDQFSNTATGYSGTVHFTSSDGVATLPANSTLTNGAGTFSVTLKTAGTQTITATDTVTSSITGTSGTITVNPAAATHFSVTAPGSEAQNASFNFTVTALDQFNNTATGYAGTVHFTSSDGSATLPANSTLTNGTGTIFGNTGDHREPNYHRYRHGDLLHNGHVRRHLRNRGVAGGDHSG